MVEVKGSAITARVRWIRENHGEGAWRQLRGSLSEAHRDLLEGKVLPHAWVPFSLFVELNERADEAFGEGDLALCRVMGRYSADVNLPTLYRIFYRLGSPSFILKKAARLWDVHYSSGRLVVEETADGAHLSIEGFEDPHRAHCLSVMGWAERSVELSGGRLVSVREISCRAVDAQTCEMEATWQ
jgi:hypothetical protein